jgi:hypothetical protein
MKTVVPTRAQLGYANGNPHPFNLVEGEAIALPDDLADALLAGGDAMPADPEPKTEPASNPESEPKKTAKAPSKK